jgi:protein PET100
MYIAFPIGWMYYFGTNLDHKFSIPDFWPKPNQMHKIPFEKDDINSELERLKQRRLRLRAERIEREEMDGIVSGAREGLGNVKAPVQRGGPLDRLGTVDSRYVREESREEVAKVESRKGWLDWARGR